MATQSNLQFFLSGWFLKVYNESWQVDILLKAGDSDKRQAPAIYAHKLVLAARSEVFKKMLESGKFKAGSVGKIDTITLSEMKHEELKAFVEFIYSNGSMLSLKEKKHVRSLFVAAVKYGIPHLRDLCRKELTSSLKLSNSLDFLELSLNPFDKILNDCAGRFVINNLVTLCDRVQFKGFVTRNPDIAIAIMKSSHTRMWNDQSF